MIEQETITYKKSRILINIAYIYVTLPFLIFIIGWIKWYYALVMCSVIIYSLLKIMKNTEPVWCPDSSKKNTLKITIILLIISILVFLSGIGKYAWQNFDHSTRNTIFRIMVEDEWPLISYDWNCEGSGLIYYIGFWLPAAVIGKLTNLYIGNFFQVIWAILGILIVYFLISSIIKKLLIWPLLLFLFFSGLDILGAIITIPEKITLIHHLEWWTGNYYQYSSVITQIFWVYNQSIPAWCITMLMFIQTKSDNLIFLLALSMLCSTIPFLGLIPLVIYLILTRSELHLVASSGSNLFSLFKKIVKEVCTFQNILGGGIIGIISFLYLQGNSASQYISINLPLNVVRLIIYYIFIFLEVGVYLLVIYKYQKKNGIYYLIGVCLSLFPFVKVGTSADFCMRASIPALLILILLVIDTILQAYCKRDMKTIIILFIIFLIGSVTPIIEINRTVINTYNSFKAYGSLEIEEDTRKEVYEELNISGVKYSGNIKDNVFYEIFVK